MDIKNLIKRLEGMESICDARANYTKDILFRELEWTFRELRHYVVRLNHRLEYLEGENKK